MWTEYEDIKDRDNKIVHKIFIVDQTEREEFAESIENWKKGTEMLEHE